MDKEAAVGVLARSTQALETAALAYKLGPNFVEQTAHTAIITIKIVMKHTIVAFTVAFTIFHACTRRYICWRGSPSSRPSYVRICLPAGCNIDNNLLSTDLMTH